MTLHLRFLMLVITLSVWQSTASLGLAQDSSPADAATLTSPDDALEENASAAPTSKYLRVVTDEYDEPLALQTPTVRFVRQR